MPTPAEIEARKQIAVAQNVIGLVDSLDKCQGWRDWLKPQVFDAHDTAARNILEAVAEGRAPASADTSTYQALHPIVSKYNTALAAARAAVGLKSKP